VEKKHTALSGYIVLLVVAAEIAALIFGVVIQNPLLAVAAAFILIHTLPGFLVISPNESGVLTLFGAYKGTILTNGFFWVNPFYTRNKRYRYVREIWTHHPLKSTIVWGIQLRLEQWWFGRSKTRIKQLLT